MLESDSTRGQGVYVRGLVYPAVTTDAGNADIVNENENNIGFCRCGGIERKPGGKGHNPRCKNSKGRFHYQKTMLIIVSFILLRDNFLSCGFLRFAAHFLPTPWSVAGYGFSSINSRRAPLRSWSTKFVE
jgi:hypothetical protein